jgi:CheY-like chemotaxis protein
MTSAMATRTAALVIDEDRTNRKLLTIILQQAGFDVRAAGSGEDALTILETFTPAVVLLELELPGMSGLDFVARVREDPRHDAAALVAVTARNGPVLAAAARLAGCQAYIRKPIDPFQFVPTIQALLGDRT